MLHAAIGHKCRYFYLPAVLLSLCLLLTVGACGSSNGGAHGTISGDVVAEPTCPVEQVGHPCPPKAVTGRQVTIETPGGATVATTMTDANGRFAIAVAPGKYIVHVQVGAGLLGMRQITPGDVTVIANQTATIQIVLDTGIR
jgi:hypothetical protein